MQLEIPAFVSLMSTSYTKFNTSSLRPPYIIYS